jgi:hypothetical protein
VTKRERVFRLWISTGETVTWHGTAADGHDAASQYLAEHPLYEVVGFTDLEDQ